MKLYLCRDGTPVAEYREHKYHLLPDSLDSDAEPACLQVYPKGEHILDSIVMSLVYVDKLRKDSQRVADVDVPGVVGG